MARRPLDDDALPGEVLRYHARLLNSRSWRWPFLEPTFHTFAGALYWADEMPFLRRMSQLEDALRILWYYRTGLILGEQREWKEYWDRSKELFPRWVGFHPSRCTPCRRYRVIYRAGRMAVNKCLAEMEREVGFPDESS